MPCQCFHTRPRAHVPDLDRLVATATAHTAVGKLNQRSYPLGMPRPSHRTLALQRPRPFGRRDSGCWCCECFSRHSAGWRDRRRVCRRDSSYCCGCDRCGCRCRCSRPFDSIRIQISTIFVELFKHSANAVNGEPFANRNRNNIATVARSTLVLQSSLNLE